MAQKKLPLREALKNNILLAFIFFIVEIPFLLLSGQIAYYIFNRQSQNDWDFMSVFPIATVDFLLHFMPYVFFRFIIKKKINVSVIVAQLTIVVLLIPAVIDDYLHTTIVLDNMAIWIAACILSQAVMFGAFTGVVTLLDRHTGLRDWKKILISFITSIPASTLVSWSLWVLLMKLHFSIRGI
jgi:hypothetical protein